MTTKTLKWDADQVDSFLRREFPQAFAGGTDYRIGTLQPGHVSVHMTAGEQQLRPGATVSGPALMEFVDFSIYVLLLAHHKDSARLSVTTNLQISFLRKAERGELRCDVELIKHGRTLSVAASRIVQVQSDRLVAHSEATYYMGEAR